MKIVLIEPDEIKNFIFSQLIQTEWSDFFTVKNEKQLFHHLDTHSEPFILILDINKESTVNVCKLYSQYQLPTLQGLVIVTHASIEIIEAVKHMFTSIGLFNIEYIDIQASWQAIHAKIKQAEANAATLNIPAPLSQPPLHRYDIQQAVEQGLFVPYFQAKVCTQTEAITGFEVLSRLEWKNTLYTPYFFITELIQLNLITAFTYQVFSKALDAITTVADYSGTLSLNIEYQSLNQPQFAAELLNIANASGFPLDKIIFEITESVSIISLEVMSNLVELKLAGCTISVDDFGMQNSGFNELLKLPFSEIKIDRSFVSKMRDCERSFNTVKAITAVANALGYRVVAEGVESQREREILQQLGIHQLQGFLYSQPLPIKEAAFLLENTQNNKSVLA